MSADRPSRQTSEGLIVALAIISVALIVVPAGIYAGMVLALLVLATVLSSMRLRRDPRMLIVSVIAIVATTGIWIASRTFGG